ncbi:unnamed protein product [Arctogadus glacialis]
MNPSPDRGKECLPPKKRESRQGSAEQHAPPADEFKPPVPVRSRPGGARGEGGRDPNDGGGRLLIKQNRHVLTSPPPLPVPAPSVPLPLPWHVPYPSPLPLFPGHVGERRGSGSPSWRDDPLSSPLSNHSRWLRGDGALSLQAPQTSAASSPSFKTPYPSDSREMWSYFNSGQRDYSSPLFSPPQLFSHPPLFPPDAGLADARDRYLVKRPNGLDGPGSRTASTCRLPPLSGDYVNDRTRINLSPHGPHANGGRRQQEELSGRAPSGGVFFPNSLPQESPEIHSSLQDSSLMLKTSPGLFSASPNHLGPDPRAERGGLLEALGVPPAEAQIYYSLGSVQQSGLQPQAQAFPFYPPSETPLYTPLKEPGLRQHSMGSSPLFSHRLPSNHDRSQKEQEPDHGRDRERESLSALRQREHNAAESERLRENEAERARGHDKEREREGKDAERDGEHERRRTRDRIRERDRNRAREGHPASTPATQPSPPAFLPHFTKGSLIELASGRLKRVEELRTEDFLRSADTSPEFHLSTCTVLLIAPGNAHGFNHLQVNLNDRNTQELLKVLEEYPFFVRDRGWSSCCPPRTAQLYGLPCRQLAEGDVCLALTPTPAHRTHATSRSSSRAHRSHPSSSAGGESSSSSSSSSSPREQMPPPPPPPPLLHHQHHHHHQNHPPPTVPPLPPPAPAAPPAAQVQQQPRKRRWSAPDAMKLMGRDESLLDLPQGSKQMKWQ